MTEPEKLPLAKNRIVRIVLLGCGFLFALLALLGALLPLLPTTPFLLVSAACFYRSSAKFYHLIFYNPLFGHYLRDYKEGRGVPLRVKALALTFTWSSTIVSVIFFIPWLWLKILVIAISAAITVHVLMIRTRKQ
jgi:uncharacterized membrane protein YbaN (DUF454 family)